MLHFTARQMILQAASFSGLKMTDRYQNNKFLWVKHKYSKSSVRKNTNTLVHNQEYFI